MNHTPSLSVPPHWRRSLIWLAVCWALILTLFHSDWAAMARQWWDISTYNHMLFVPLIIGWLVWQRWPQLRLLSPSGWWPGLIVAALAMLMWVLGAMTGFDLLRQSGVVALLGASCLAVLGPRVAAGLVFPLFYLVFLIPVGEELVPLLQMITAKLTVGLVQISGIPALIDGVFIDTPVGLFEVAEACSGVKFLIAMIALGTLISHVCFINTWRRAAFMLLCVIVSILGNAVRAWGTVFAAQYVGVERAAGIDHLIYGWVFFAVLIACVMAAGWRFFDRPADDAFINATSIQANGLIARLKQLTIPAIGAAAVLGWLMAGGLMWADYADRLSAPVPRQIFLPDVPGWSKVSYSPQAWWQPQAGGAEHKLLGSYRNQRGQRVDVFYALYSAQGEGREASGWGQGAIPPEAGWVWTAAGPAIASGRSERLAGPNRAERLAETYYRTGDLLTGSATRLKLAGMADRLRLRPRTTALLILSVETRAGENPQAVLESFRVATGPVASWIDRIAMNR